jgi:putative membrane protein insertion efficiency factor
MTNLKEVAMAGRNRPIVALFKFYKRAVSPYLPVACRFTPSCSVYAAGCFERYGILKAGRLTLKRLLRCRPFAPYGYDPVPGDTKH